jgi:hypothetical protein
VELARAEPLDPQEGVPIAADVPAVDEVGQVAGNVENAAQPVRSAESLTNPTSPPEAEAVPAGERPEDASPTEKPRQQSPATPVPTEPASEPKEEPVATSTPEPVPTDTAAAAPTATPLPTAVPETGVIAGQVTGPDGRPRAEVRVVAVPIDVGDGPPVDVYTGVDGTYSLDLSPGEWVVWAVAPAYQVQWFEGQGTPFGATPVSVAAGASRTDVDFELAPNPRGWVTGRVIRADGEPVADALVVAVSREGATAAPFPSGRAIFTTESGGFTLHLPPGAYAIGVTADWRRMPALWWEGRASAEEADVVVVGEEGEEGWVEFVLL